MLASGFTNSLGAWATAVAAVGTLAAVAIALYRDSWRAARRRPHLDLSFAEPRRASSPAGFSGGIQGYLSPVRLRVTNAPGRDTARDVEVLLSAWWDGKQPSGRWYQTLDNRPLPWADEYETGLDITRATLAPGVGRQMEFLRFGRPHDVQRVLAGKVRAKDFITPVTPGEYSYASRWAFFVAPPFDGTTAHTLESHLRYRVRLLVTARDVDAVAYDAVLEVAATWNPDPASGDGSFKLRWRGLSRAASPTAPFSL